MRVALSLVALLLGAAPLPDVVGPGVVGPGGRDAGVFRLADDAEGRWTAFDLTPGNQIRFTMQVDGRDVVAILDTGVSFSVLGRRSAAVVPVKLVPGGSATAIGGTVAIEWMPTTIVTLGAMTRTGGGLSVAALPAMATGGAMGGAAGVDLLVGRDLLAGYALDIDHASRRFRLLRSGRMPFAGATAPLAISAARRVYESAITIGGHRLAPMVVDTGDGSSITLTTPGWRATKLTGLPTTTAMAFGLGGATVSGLAILPELRLGTLVARSAEVRIEPEGGFSQSIGAAGRIGTGFLQHYRVLLDPGAGRMVLAREPGADVAPVRSTSGLLLGLERDRLKILHVMAGGPAAAAGWKSGETICAIDGAAVTAAYPTSPIAAWSAGVPGRVVRLTSCDGTVRILTLKRFY